MSCYVSVHRRGTQDRSAPGTRGDPCTSGHLDLKVRNHCFSSSSSLFSLRDNICQVKCEMPPEHEQMVIFP